jgi:hypothetical protein
MHRHGPSPLDGPVSADWWQPDPQRPFRAELVSRIRAEIALGTYETQEKWEAALEQLFRHMEGD